MKATSSNEWDKTKKTDQTKMQNKYRSNTLCRTNEDQKLCRTNEYLADQTDLLNHHI